MMAQCEDEGHVLIQQVSIVLRAVRRVLALHHSDLWGNRHDRHPVFCLTYKL